MTIKDAKVFKASRGIRIIRLIYMLIQAMTITLLLTIAIYVIFKDLLHDNSIES
jgi:hypothetical protein